MTCLDCGRQAKARQLCDTCRQRHTHRGDLADYPRRTGAEAIAYIVAELDFLRGESLERQLEAVGYAGRPGGLARRLYRWGYIEHARPFSALYARLGPRRAAA